MTEQQRRWLRIAVIVLAVLLAYGLIVTGNLFLAVAVAVIAAAILISLAIQRREPPELGE